MNFMKFMIFMTFMKFMILDETPDNAELWFVIQ